MEAVLKVKNLSKYFGERLVVEDISFEVNQGEVFGFLGPNGAGKTTTIKMIMGFLSMDSGEVIINGYNLKKDYEKAMSQIGGIVENPEMYKTLSGITNLEMYARVQGNVGKERIEQAVKLVGMQNRIDDIVGKYSLGMKQRIGLAQALLHKPPLLILDEPTNGLDPAGIKELRDILKKLAREENVAIMVSSHLLAEMELMCDRVGIINNGKFLGIKSVEELTSNVSGRSKYRFSTKQGTEASKLLVVSEYAGFIVAMNQEYIELEIEEGQVPEITAMLVGGGISIYGVSKIDVSLEDAFLKITGGDTSIA
ncbi:MAG: ABC transporter ATP-binding protein [Oscillospiraceae bacterium]|nr:ABC transporter ATP-binding protein [Oscillospiraceae bacterium]